ncbi:hypothetical protein MHC_01440 [Mycoplasma haemocanis str. Illinois]|uniref:Uncharacterized protein n=1 Tax=Mycoplasma haemocanis (strain Illinois) TaxID=1111676 RepID=H6N682_MYCHN|nr:hypothetical protein [Mycoplasma haemocanis]AEW45154.1 hypothetical protein MHC_01440 [Mycoplasma haemocanis str. Illinois]
MTLPAKIGLGCVGVVGISGVGYLGSNLIKNEPRETFKSKYSVAIKGFLDNSTTLNKKLEALEKSSTDPKHPELIAAKNHKKGSKNKEAEESLKRGCKDIHNKPVDNGFLEDFKNYCSFNNEDKIETGKSLVASNSDLGNKWSSFNQKTVKDLHEEFKDINKPANGSADEAWKGSMLSKCKKLAAEIFKGEISNFKEFCIKS